MHNCPCCGDITYGSAVLCDECIVAECEMTKDATGELGYWECSQECPQGVLEGI